MDWRAHEDKILESAARRAGARRPASVSLHLCTFLPFARSSSTVPCAAGVVERRSSEEMLPDELPWKRKVSQICPKCDGCDGNFMIVCRFAVPKAFFKKNTIYDEFCVPNEAMCVPLWQVKVERAI